MAKAKTNNSARRASKSARTEPGKANTANSVEKPAGSGQVSGAGNTFDTTGAEPLPKEDQLRTAQEERYNNNPEGTRIDGTTARHTEPLGPPAPGQRGVPGPERRVVPQAGARQPGVGVVPDTPEGMAEYKASLGKVIRVQATQTGYIDNVRRRAGDVFDCREAEFSDNWMRMADGSTPKRSTGAQAALKAHHDETIASRLGLKTSGAAPRSSGDTDPLNS